MYDVRKFQVSTMKIETVALIWNLRIIGAMITQRIRKLNNKLINLGGIKLFHIVL